MIKSQDVSDINVGDKALSVGLFNFRAFVNIGMLLTESEKLVNRYKAVEFDSFGELDDLTQLMIFTKSY